MFNLRTILIFGVMVMFYQEQHAQNTTDLYIGTYVHTAKALSDSFGIPVSLILGLAIVESGSGTSRNCRIMKNHFGIKGKNNLAQRGIKFRSAYKSYDTDSLSFVDFCLYLKKRKFYPALKGNFNYNAWLNAMAKSGYSTAPKTWKLKIITTIKKYNLTALDTPDATAE